MRGRGQEPLQGLYCKVLEKKKVFAKIEQMGGVGGGGGVNFIYAECTCSLPLANMTIFNS